jgi:hypothetical protein
MPRETGRSAIVIPVPVAEPLVSAWRSLYDPSAVVGMPAHLAALYPFLHPDDLCQAVLATLVELCAALPVLNITVSPERSPCAAAPRLRSERSADVGLDRVGAKLGWMVAVANDGCHVAVRRDVGTFCGCGRFDG